MLYIVNNDAPGFIGKLGLLQAGIERIQGRAVGRMLIAVAGTEAAERLVARADGIAIERIGYVAADD